MSAKGQSRRRPRSRKNRRVEQGPVERGGAPIRAPHHPTKVERRKKRDRDWRKDMEDC